MKEKRFDQLKTSIEILIVFVIFYIFGAWAVPDSNEPYYVGKAIHFWNPDWISNDPFLQSKDSHWAFYVVFGWLSFFLSPSNMAWTGRFLTWGLLAWSWRRFSFALIPVRWMAIPSALALAYYVDSFNMAGEWILGGIEGKSFAFPFVFLGLEAMIRGRWHRTWIFLGIASAFHVLVGGWSVLISLFVWLLSSFKNQKPTRQLRFALPWGLFLGGLISLFGLIPALLLDHGVSTEIVKQAHQIYVFDRLYHHLVPHQFPWTYTARFFLLTAIWILICRSGRRGNRKIQRFEMFVWGTLILSLIGIAVAYGLRDNRTLAAELLRFYWFRLSDVFVPVGIAIGALRRLLKQQPGILATGFPFRTIGAAISGLSLLLGVPFLIYLLFDAILFGQRLSSTVVAEPCVPWALTILVCWGCLVFSKQILRLKPFQTWASRGFILLYVAILFYAPFDSLKTLGDARTCISYSRIEPGRPYIAYYWIDACRWIADPKNTPQTAKFWVPRDGATFKWHAKRSDVGTWKNVPQDAEGIVQWQKMMQDLFCYRNEEGDLCDDRSLTILLWWKSDEEMEQLRKEYGFDYILCSASLSLSQHKCLRTVYENELFRVYQMIPAP